MFAEKMSQWCPPAISLWHLEIIAIVFLKSLFAASKSCKYMTEFMYLGATTKKKIFLKFLQSLEKIMKKFSEVVDWNVVLFLKKHSLAS